MRITRGAELGSLEGCSTSRSSPDRSLLVNNTLRFGPASPTRSNTDNTACNNLSSEYLQIEQCFYVFTSRLFNYNECLGLSSWCLFRVDRVHSESVQHGEYTGAYKHRYVVNAP